MKILLPFAIFVIFSPTFIDANSQTNNNCANVTCPEQLECSFPNTPIPLPDPTNPCCTKMVCNCANVTCPEQLECSFPNTPIPLPDPTNPCCTKMVCTCKGTDYGLSSSSSTRTQHENLRLRYQNCTLVDGNLELVGVHNQVQYIDFTKHIEQVTGYVLISRMYADYIDLTSLRLIRGSSRYVKRDCQDTIPGTSTTSSVTTSVPGARVDYALYVKDNNPPGSIVNSGLKELWMPNLTEITEGNVIFSNNRLLCHIDSILWTEEIFESPQQRLFTDDLPPKRTCPSCPSECVHASAGPDPHCWSNNSSHCQIITKSTCQHCGSINQRCNAVSVDSDVHQCCNDACAAGCLGRGPDKCYACKNVNNNGTCEKTCPLGDVQDPVTGQLISKPKKFQFTRYCVTKCPPNAPLHERFCQTYCPPNYFDFGDNECTSCAGGRCDNICFGLGVKKGPLENDTYINARNIHHFNKSCTIIEGSLYFSSTTFDGDRYCSINPLKDQSAFSVFENVREITGFLDIETWKFKDLCIFKNLRKIRGKELRTQLYSLTVFTGSDDIRELCLNSLETIENGNVLIMRNKRLCSPKSVNWSRFYSNATQQYAIIKRNKKSCKNARCYKECNATEGCWGASNDQCVACKNYMDLTDDRGQLAPEWVIDQSTGVRIRGNTVTRCVAECNFDKGVYPSDEKKCLPCHPNCNRTCTGPGPSNCTSCIDYLLDGECVVECPKDHYSDMNKTCHPCSPGCTDGGCIGPLHEYNTDAGCLSCYYSINPETMQHIYRGRKCSMCAPEKIDRECLDGCSTFNNTSFFECVILPTQSYTVFIVLGVLLFVLCLVLVLWKFQRHRKTIKRMRKAIGDTMVGEHGAEGDEAMPLTPSGTAPNQAQLRIVKDDELAMGRLLGSGAFGAVHKAIWNPLNIQGEKVKIAVAVKMLKTPEEMSHDANNEIMDEAYMMASVDCVYLVRLLGICMTGHVSLITQLMPLGSLLEYVRDTKNHETIHSRQMLQWFVQIAKGMLYLEEKHLVHRDLAARNVLVKTPNHVKITDFGLAKMLDVKEDTYHAEGGKLPIKWLAIECITQRKFSHLSDVWAYGITCWELLTFGSRPYEGVRAVEVLSLLEQGDRLPQPPSATIDIYMILIKCWMVDRQCRPSFAELVSDFSRMVIDPTRYVVLKNDPGQSMLSPSPMDEDKFFRQLMQDEEIDDAIIADEPDQYLLCSNSNEQINKYTPMSALASTSTTNSNQPVTTPFYANQSTINNEQKQNTAPGGHDRLFSRSTPSAHPEPLVPSLTSAEGAAAPDGSVRVNSNSDQDDVFADTGNSAKNRANLLAADAQKSRKDSEETQRYTEDPTNKKIIGSGTKKLAEDGNPSSFAYDDELYLLPTPNKSIPVYLDPEGIAPVTQYGSSLMNDTYVDSPPLSVPPTLTSDPGYTRLSQCQGNNGPEYVNTAEGENLTPTWFSNEEYMATDSGIGEDTQSLLSRGNTGNRGPRKESTQSSNDGNERLVFKDSQVQFRPNQRKVNGTSSRDQNLWSTSSDGSSPSRSPGAAIDNPEYMLLNAATSKNSEPIERTASPV